MARASSGLTRTATVTERFDRESTPAGVKRLRRLIPPLRSAMKRASCGSTDAGVNTAGRSAPRLRLLPSNAVRAKPAVGISARLAAAAARLAPNQRDRLDVLFPAT